MLTAFVERSPSSSETRRHLFTAFQRPTGPYTALARKRKRRRFTLDATSTWTYIEQRLNKNSTASFRPPIFNCPKIPFQSDPSAGSDGATLGTLRVFSLSTSQSGESRTPRDWDNHFLCLHISNWHKSDDFGFLFNYSAAPTVILALLQH